jgi:hypothetical protein
LAVVVARTENSGPGSPREVELAKPGPYNSVCWGQSDCAAGILSGLFEARSPSMINGEPEPLLGATIGAQRSFECSRSAVVIH